MYVKPLIDIFGNFFGKIKDRLNATYLFLIICTTLKIHYELLLEAILKIKKFSERAPQQLISDIYEIKTKLKSHSISLKAKLCKSEQEQYDMIIEKGSEKIKCFIQIFNIKPEEAITEFKKLCSDCTPEDILKISKWKGIKITDK